MFTVDYRPETLDDVYGQEFAKKIIRSLCLDVVKAPKNLLFYGDWGVGKTTLAKIFAKEINLNKYSPSLYTELDASVVGNVETIRNMRDDLLISYNDSHRVIVFDEIHLASSQAQSALLKILEEPNNKNFFIFITTEKDKLLKTIISRTFPVPFNPLTKDELFSLLNKISLKESGQKVSEKVLTLIYNRTKGHARDALQQLELCLSVGEGEYLNNLNNLNDLIRKFLISAYKKENAEIFAEQLCQNPVLNLDNDFSFYMTDLLKKIVLGQNSKLNEFRKVIDFFFRNHFYLRTSDDWYIFFLEIIDLFQNKSDSSISSYKNSNRYRNIN